MIIEQTGNILDSTCEHIVIPVNTMGVMGKGLAKEFAERYPELEIDYKNRCWLVKPNGGHVSRQFPAGKFYYFFTKEHYKNPSKIEWIEKGLDFIASDMICAIEFSFQNQSIAIPPLGCGLGGLNWDDVYPLIQKYLGNIEGLTVHVYLPR